jgi:uncharacterized phiE125 gp8 family phage protein
VAGAVTVRFTAGYGDNASDVPASIRQALLVKIGQDYEARQDVVMGVTANTLPGGVLDRLAPYRVATF